jgi:hypothetical protein
MAGNRFALLMTVRTAPLAGESFEYTVVGREPTVPPNEPLSYEVRDATGAAVAELRPCEPALPVDRPWYRYRGFAGVFVDGALVYRYEHRDQGGMTMADAEIVTATSPMAGTFHLTVRAGPREIGRCDVRRKRPFDPIAVLAADGAQIATVQRIRIHHQYLSLGDSTRITFGDGVAAWPGCALLTLIPALDHLIGLHTWD